MLHNRYFSIIYFFIILTASYYSISSQTATTSSGSSPFLTDFSTKRALDNLKEISKTPRYVGSPGHQSAQSYIVKQLQLLGLETEIPYQMSINPRSRSSAYTRNILARIKGTDSDKALLLLTHYDSAPHSSLGASDAGSGVVTILESVRAFLASRKQPKNDIILLFSDAEETGLLGAIAFVKHHRWAKDVGLVLNFEARGSGGPGYMIMETNGGNKNLVQAFSQAGVSHPVANSLMYSIYKMLPNDIDLTIFREDGDNDGYNFAFIDDHFDYHTAQDSYQRLDTSSLRHQASYLLPLLRYFADTDLTNIKSGLDYVYFTMPTIGMLYYPYSWVNPVLFLVIILFFGLIIYGVTSQKIKTKNTLTGFLPQTISLLTSSLLTFYGWKLLLIIYPHYTEIQQGFTYNGHYYIAAFSSLSLAITFSIYAFFIKKIEAAELAIAPILFWILINIAIASYLKGAGYFIIPVLLGLASIVMLLFFNSHPQRNRILLTLLSIPVLLIFVPMIAMFPIGLGLNSLAISTTLIVLLTGLLIPLFTEPYVSRFLGASFSILSLALFVFASLESGYDEDKKQPNSIIYTLDTDNNIAYWASYDSKTDVFTRQFLGENPAKEGFDQKTAINKYDSKYNLFKKTKIRDIALPVIDLISDSTSGNVRKVHLSITSQRGANRFTLIANSVVHYNSISINGEKITQKNENGFVLVSEKTWTLLRHTLTDKNEKLDLIFAFSKNDILDLTLYEVSYDLLDSTLFTLASRSKEMMPKPFVINDAIVVKKRLVFGTL